jgi:hypothetical protein
MRAYHWLRPNPTTKIPKHHIAVATVCRPSKADPEQLELAAWSFQGGTFDGGKWTAAKAKSGDDDVLFWPYLQRALAPKGKTWVWLLCPRLDLPALRFAHELEQGRFIRRYWVFGDPPVIIDGSYCGRSVRFVGLENWLPGDARRVAEYCGYPIHWDEVQSEYAASLDQIATCDACNLSIAVGRILRTVYREDLGHLRPTVGGQSLQSYRHQWLPGKVLCHGHAEALRLERTAAVGWPPDLRRLGEVRETVYVCDVNALYPHVMASYPYPRKLLWHTESATAQDLRVAGQSALLIARVKVSDWSRSYLVTENGKCRSVRGAWSGTLVGPDLDSALSRGVVEHVWEAAGYEGAGLFCGWAEWVWQMRQRYKSEGDQVGAHVAKMLSVALWGQFAARLQRYVSTDDVPAPQPYGEFFYHPVGALPGIRCRAVAGLVDRLDSRDEPADSIPAISAFVACYARAYMQGLRAIVGDEHVVYQVADSLHVDLEGYQRLYGHGLIDPGAMGKLKLVRKVERSCYLAANTVVQDDELTAAGIYVRATMVRPGVYRWRLPRRLTETLTSPPTGTVSAPEVCRSVADCPPGARLPR